MKHLGYDVMTFGNHEFDDGLGGLVPFAKNVSGTFPIVSSTINSVGSILEGHYTASYIKIIGGEKVGFVGFTTTDTADTSNSGNSVKFLEIISALKSAVAELISDGDVNKIIAVGHAGFTTDKEVCKQVPGVDIVVGGHTNTFLYTGTPPSNDEPEGTYPEVFRDTGNPCLVVQDYAFGKYLGLLQVQFDNSGTITAWSGNPVLLDNSYAEDVDTTGLLEPYRSQLAAYKGTVLTRTATAINGSFVACRLSECNLGNLLTDAAVFGYVKQDSESSSWTDAAICLWNSGGMRPFTAEQWDNLTLSDLSSILPYGNVLERVQLSGKNIRLAFEHSVAGYDPVKQLGAQVVYDLSQPVGSRVVQIKVRCKNCKIPKYQLLVDEENYDIITSSYLLGGGDGHKYFTKYTFRDHAELVDLDVVKKYFETFDPVMPLLEGRIQFVGDEFDGKNCLKTSNGAVSFESVPILSLNFTILTLCALCNVHARF